MAATTSDRPYHIIIFGATGFTGQFVVEEVARCAAEAAGGSALRWAVAGRSRQRLEAVLEQAARRLCMSLTGWTSEELTETGQDRSVCGQARTIKCQAVCHCRRALYALD